MTIKGKVFFSFFFFFPLFLFLLILFSFSFPSSFSFVFLFLSFFLYLPFSRKKLLLGEKLIYQWDLFTHQHRVIMPRVPISIPQTNSIIASFL